VTSLFSAAGAEFLENYQRDVPLRWSPKDLAAQREFVGAKVAGGDWLDWSTPAAALHLVQPASGQTSAGGAKKCGAVVLAGPIVELVEPLALLGQARGPLGPDGRLVGIVPCLRDNSPESDQFIRHAKAMLWPYYTAEELLEILRESAWQTDSRVSGFIPIPRFNLAVLNDQLGFKGFNRIFTRLSGEGYDPMEVGWGELRFVARWAC
jgi:hypothetical protein